MQVVGDHLSAAAISHKGSQPAEDLFARSAFNRYYYGAFLVSRQFLKDTIGVTGLPHKSIPGYLTTTFQKQVKRQLKESERSGLVSKGNHSRLLNGLKKNVQLLTELLSEAYRVRVLADYEPDVPVQQENQTYRLGTATLDGANRWEGRAHLHCKNLRSIWSELGN